MTASGRGSARWYVRGAPSLRADRRAIASTTKSTGTRFTGFFPEPTLRKTPGEGILSIAVSMKYGPSNFPVSPVRESPTTMDGR